MQCERFWDEVNDYLPDCFESREIAPMHLKVHLETCPKCRREFELFCTGLGALKKEIHAEEDAYFWHEMREEVRSRVPMPCRRFSFLSRFFSPWSLGWAAAAVVLFLLVFRGFSPHGPSLTRQDLVAMFGNDPFVSLYNETRPVDLDLEQDETDPYIYSGLSDTWTSLMAETCEEQAEVEQGREKRRKSHENSVSGRSYRHCNFAV